ncbi:hypothetical protein PG996_005226 [Apiospora saccharicola]|uniref:Uncharacterized protein n=1 Tax=Apiospora saccharicola TaxID=335842 RepID=A0ABR1VKV9_9PEZI
MSFRAKGSSHHGPLHEAKGSGPWTRLAGKHKVAASRQDVLGAVGLDRGMEAVRLEPLAQGVLVRGFHQLARHQVALGVLHVEFVVPLRHPVLVVVDGLGAGLVERRAPGARRRYVAHDPLVLVVDDHDRAGRESARGQLLARPPLTPADTIHGDRVTTSLE